ncbi:MAG: hypothetical protein Q8J85_07205 [Sulfuricurvum sp.]|nr:hypothetical protein [Sulfuricurvum sp.]MDP3022986.1 hypothetical protein [Sulfuricurvum sp.]
MIFNRYTHYLEDKDISDIEFLNVYLKSCFLPIFEEPVIRKGYYVFKYVIRINNEYNKELFKFNPKQKYVIIYYTKPKWYLFRSNDLTETRKFY